MLTHGLQLQFFPSPSREAEARKLEEIFLNTLTKGENFAQKLNYGKCGNYLVVLKVIMMYHFIRIPMIVAKERTFVFPVIFNCISF